MSPALPSSLRRLKPGPLGLQAILACAVLALALSPVRGGAALYLPLLSTNTAGTIAWSRTRHAEILAQGPYAGALYIRVHGQDATLGALSRGALLVAVPESLCAAGRTPQTTETP